VRILDKYLLREFCWPVLYCFDAITLLWLVGDLFNHLDEFVDAHARVPAVARYYLTVFPDIFVQILPVALLLGLLFCLANLARHNELSAMRSGGISRWRLMLPFLAVGAAAALLVGFVNEFFAPGCQVRGRERKAAIQGQPRSGVLVNFLYANATAGFHLRARTLDPRTGVMESPELHELNPDGTPRRDFFAQRATWRDNGWLFTDVRIDNLQQTPAVILRVAETNFPALRESPERLVLLAEPEPRNLTTDELGRFIRVKQRNRDVAGLAPYQVAWHERFAVPWTSLLVVWIGIPLGMQIGRGGALRSVGMALGLVVAFYFLTHITRALGGAGWLVPPLAAWLTPVLLFGAGAILFRRIP
jgi:lipopolysaccharide export system permease protein